MTLRNYSNTAVPQPLAAAVTAGATTLTVPATTGFPDAPFLLGLERGTANEEVVLCTAKSATTFTVQRGYDGTGAKPHAIGAMVEHTVAAIDYREAGIIRVTTAARDALSGENLWAGRVVFNTTTGQHEAYSGSTWRRLLDSDHITADDHTQYLNLTRHDSPDRHGPSSVDHGSIGGLEDDDHPQYLNASRHNSDLHRALLPAGTMVLTAAASAPSGWLLCNGAAVSRTTYSDLFAAIGTFYGSGNGSTTFNLPNTLGRVAVGAGTLSGDSYSRGDVGGLARVALSESELPSHSHSSGTLATGSTTVSGGNHSHSSGTLVTSTTGSHTHGSGNLETWNSGSHTHSLYASSVGYDSGTHYRLRSDSGTDTRSTGSGGNHNHTIVGATASGGSHSHNISGSTSSETHSHGSHSHSISGSTGTVGSGNSHENRQPYFVAHYIIRA